MKKLLIIIVAIAVYLHFYPSSEFSLWVDQQKNMLLDKFGEATDTKVRLSAKKIRSDLEVHLKSFSSDEQEYLQSVTESRTTIVKFFHENCEGSADNVQLHQANLKIVCKTIGQYQSLF